MSTRPTAAPQKVDLLLSGCDVVTIDVLPEGSPAANPAFDVTPARFVTGLITERGVCAASVEGLSALFPDLAAV